ncbi:amino acid decarboxylase [Brachybacterium endophyticum]|uniref:Amino acid decarboxylase n=1 Tax=Brachybacterium endophyticum TaxID=2182385 RepID=A0A2U2RJM0_9MICO|nr:FAD/NAD(P)-binding protein [Brachybacterium endophyticum]PWH06031.1 amino acid decarboxylase [Brachybacterium endophyticum]
MPEPHRVRPLTLRIGVVGAGPKALYALEDLTALLDAHPPPPVAGRKGLVVTVLDAVQVPGTGAAYDPRQPHHLSLNVTAAILDEPPTGTCPSFAAWVTGPYPQLADEPYPPRAVVGEYLALRWQRMITGLARHAQVRRVTDRVTDVLPRDDGWYLATGPSWHGPMDEVLLATGHASDHAGALRHSWSSSIPLIPAALPADAMLTPDRVPPGSRVAVRGGALTFVDVCLSLTEGRGATFSARPGAPSPLVLDRSGREPAVIRPITRDGLLLDAKPDPGTRVSETAQCAVEHARARFPSEPARFGPDAVLEIVIDAATAMLGKGSRGAVEQTLRTGGEPDLPGGRGRARAALRRSIETAEGTRSPGPAWALGRMWQSLYPLVTRSLRGSDAPADEWDRFLRAARALERFAFGPPLRNARKLLALIEDGIVDLAWMDAGFRIDGEGIRPPATAPSADAAGTNDVDTVIDAVLAPPGVELVIDELARSLISRGLVLTRPGRRGVITDSAGSAIGGAVAPGARVPARPGLAVIGRPTEDDVIGNDSLNRHLHTEGRRWARRMTGRIRRPDAPEDGPQSLSQESTEDVCHDG